MISANLKGLVLSMIFIMALPDQADCGDKGRIDPLVDHIRTWVRELSRDEMKGRGLGSVELSRAAQWLADEYKRIGLEPVITNGYLQSFSMGKMQDLVNVIGSLGGLTDRFIIVSAHYDHLGTDARITGDTIYNGADDDASGIATMLGIAMLLAENDRFKKIDHGIVFLSFTGEESDLSGSTFYLYNPVLPLDRIVTVMNLEMVGHSERLGKQRLWMTSEHLTDFRDVMKEVGKLVKWRVTGERWRESNLWAKADSLVFLAMAYDRSEETVFGVPAHTISTWGGEAHYHTTGDEWTKLDYENMASLSRFLTEVVVAVSESQRGINFRESARLEIGRSRYDLRRFNSQCRPGSYEDGACRPPYRKSNDPSTQGCLAPMR